MSKPSVVMLNRYAQPNQYPQNRYALESPRNIGIAQAFMIRTTLVPARAKR